jgi:hypothetical protein
MIITAVPVANNLKARYLNPKQQSRLKEGDDRSIQLTFHQVASFQPRQCLAAMFLRAAMFILMPIIIITITMSLARLNLRIANKHSSGMWQD